MSATADGYRALHRRLLQDLYDWAGQDRTVNIARWRSSFAAVPYIARELDKLFADVEARNAFRGVPREPPSVVRLIDVMLSWTGAEDLRPGATPMVRPRYEKLARAPGLQLRGSQIS